MVNADLSGLALFLGIFLGGILTGCIGGVIAFSFDLGDSNSSFSFALLAFVLGIAIVSIILSTVESAVATTFVLWAEDPQALSRRDDETHTTYFQELARQAPTQYGF